MFFAGDHLKSKKHIHGYFIYNGFKCHYLVYKYIRSIKPDVIHTHLGTNRYIIPYMLFHRKVKVFHTVHCPPEQMFEGTPTNRKENFAIKNVLIIMCRQNPLVARIMIKIKLGCSLRE